MELTRWEERALAGEMGEGMQKAMEIVVAIGEMKDARALIPVQSVQISGVSYKTVGEAGLEFLKDFAALGARISVLATLNPAGVELGQEHGELPPRFVERQREILEVYERMGAEPVCTCTPYLAGNLPRDGEHIAWAESSAVAYANSVLNARTNRESSITALASAITGRTPLYGLHLEENRAPTFAVKVEAELEDVADYSALGYYVGRELKGIPLFTGVEPGVAELKALAAGLATGQVSMFHVEGMGEGRRFSTAGLEKVVFGEGERRSVFEELSTCVEPDVLCIGCPHCTMEEVERVLKAGAEREVWVYTCRRNKDAVRSGMEKRNIRLIADTCMVVQPLEEMGIGSVGTNSAKCAYYTRNLSGLEVWFGRTENLLKARW